MGFALAAVRGLTYGLWVSDDFSLDGPLPTWRRIHTGITFSHPEVMAVDISDAYNVQYLLGQNTILKRDGDAFRKIFDVNDAIALVGAGPFDPPWIPTLSFVSCDPLIPGRVYTIYSYYNPDAAWWKPSWSALWPGGDVLASDDYGETWYHLAQVTTPGIDPGNIWRNFTYVRGMSEVYGINGDVWASGSLNLFLGEPALCLPSNTSGYSSGYTSATFGQTNFKGNARIDPTDTRYCYIYAYGDGLYRVDAQTIINSSSGVPPRYGHIAVPAPGLSRGLWQGSSCHWINPLDNSDQIIIAERGQLYTGDHNGFTTDGIAVGGDYWAYYNGNLNLIIDDDYKSIYFTSGASILALQDRESRTPIQRGVWGYRHGFAENGLYVSPNLVPGHPYVYAVEFDNVGGDSMAEAGRRLPGSDSAFDTIQQANRHARDINEHLPTVHAPWPAKAGDAPVSDGSKWVATPISTVSGQIRRYPVGGGTGEVYEFSADGLNDAEEDATAGDKIEISGAGTITGDITLADYVEYQSSKSVIFTGLINSGIKTILHSFVIRRSDNSASELAGIIGGTSDNTTMIGCEISVDQLGAGDVYAIDAKLGGGFICENCSSRGYSVSGDGYAGRSHNGKILLRGGGEYIGSTDAFYVVP
jgi:hypothetical protein